MELETIKLQVSLQEAIERWILDTDITFLDTYLSENTAGLMAQSALSILLAQRGLTDYLKREGHFNY